jgi:hypothetical protein
MAQKKDEGGELISNKAGIEDYRDEKTGLIVWNKDVEVQDDQTEVEKTKLIGRPKNKSVPKAVIEVAAEALPSDTDPCVGWLVVWDGPGKGTSHVIKPGLNKVGRGADCDVVLDFGDTTISKSGLVGVGYDPRRHNFAFVNLGSKNPPDRNDEAVWTQSELNDSDKLLIGDTTLVFVEFCNTERNWS